MALRQEFESRLEELEGQRQESLKQIPAAAEALVRLHRKIQEADATRAAWSRTWTSRREQP